MAAPAMVMMGRAMKAYNNTVNTSSISYASQAAVNGKSDNATLNLISDLVFAESKSVRTSTIILAAFNVLAAFTTASSIVYDSYWASKRCNPKFKASKFCLSSIHPAETFPLINAIGIFIQGMVFAAVQGEGLQALFAKGCSTIAQYMWPAIFIVPYLQVVFGLECTLRSFRALPFQARGKYNVTICCGTVVLMLIATWIPSHIFPEPDICFASLLWFVSNYGKLGSVLLCVAGGFMIFSVIAIYTRLSSINLIDEHQRIAASRMVYYLAVGIVSLCFVVPFFFSLIGKGDLKLSMMATVVLNLSGLMSGLLYMFLRANTSTSSFGPRTGKNWQRGMHEIRIFGPNELVMRQHLVDPVTGPKATRDQMASRSESLAELVGTEKGRVRSLEPLKTPPADPMRYYNETGAKSDTRSPTKAGRGHVKRPSYSLFPGETSSPTNPVQQPISIYDITDLGPPPAIHYPAGARHVRNSSIASSATVQIGLRLSHAPEDTFETLPSSSTAFNTNLTPPSNAFSPALLALPATTYSSAPKTNAINRPTLGISPLKVETSFSAPTPPARSPRRPVLPPPNSDSISPKQSPKQPPVMNKTLPPTPKSFLPAVEKGRESNSNIQLSSTVYTPAQKAPSPTGSAPIGLAAVGGGPRLASSPKEGVLLKRNPSRSPVQQVQQSNSGRTPPTQMSNSGAPLGRANTKDWI